MNVQKIKGKKIKNQKQKQKLLQYNTQMYVKYAAVC